MLANRPQAALHFCAAFQEADHSRFSSTLCIRDLYVGYVPFRAVGSELLFEVFSQRYERGATLVTSNLPFDEWTSSSARNGSPARSSTASRIMSISWR